MSRFSRMGAILRPNRCTAGEWMFKSTYRVTRQLQNCPITRIKMQLKQCYDVSDRQSALLHRVYRLHERLVNLRSDYNLRLKSTVTTVQTVATGRVRPERDDVTLRYIQDLLAWVEENQQRIDEGPWGSDLPTVESQLGSHRGLHQTVEDFRSKIERARADEVLFVTRKRFPSV